MHKQRPGVTLRSILFTTIAGAIAVSIFTPAPNQRSTDALTFVALTANHAQCAFETTQLDGAAIYKSQCVQCHGETGQGVEGYYDSPLVGDLSIKELAKIIDQTMPEDDPSKCVGDDATAVATYMHGAFYSPAARDKNLQASVELSRLTANQYLLTVSDLLATFGRQPASENAPGLKGEYFTKKGINYTYGLKQRTFERIDTIVDFDFGEQGPQPMARDRDDFGARWSGSIYAPRTGDYEFAIRTQNGARLYVNGREPVVDAWVDSRKEPTRYTGTIRLIAGHRYPMALEFHTYQEPNASIQLLWKMPEGEWELVPAMYFTQQQSPVRFVLTHDLPPDDSSAGFARGTQVSKSWDDATTRGAIETMRYIVDHQRELIGFGRDDNEETRTNKTKKFCFDFVTRAFRRPLTPEQTQFFVERHFQEAPDTDSALKRCVLLALKSPRFLYPTLDAEQFDEFTIASAMALALWDSLPDKTLYELAKQGKLSDPNVRRQQSARMLNDPRAQQKLHDFICEWIKLEECTDLAKDNTLFPEFNEQLVAELRTSLELMVDEVVRQAEPDYRKLLLSNEMYVSQRIARFYKLDGPTVEPFEKVQLKNKNRAGIVTHPLLLATHAYHKSTSPIHRGVFLSRQVLGRTLKDPPDDIEFEDSDFEPSMTMREKVSLVTKPVACQACHQIINPVGFALEHFDSVGRFRTKENKRDIDATVSLPTPDGKEVKLTNARELAEYAASDPIAQQGFVRQMFQFAIKQPPSAYGSDTVPRLHKQFADAKFNMKKLWVEIAMTSIDHTIEKNQEPTSLDQNN